MNILSVPCIWQEEALLKMLNLKSANDITIGEVYGTLSSGLPHGRFNDTVMSIDKNHALKIKSIIDEKGVEFAYLFNASHINCSFDLIKDELQWVIDVFRPSSFTVASLDVMEWLRYNGYDMKINISTVSGVKTVNDLEKYLHISPAKLVAHHDVNRNFDELSELASFCTLHNIELEIMLNESCLRRCAKRKEHYDAIADNKDDHCFHNWCNRIKLTDSYHFLEANFILPQNMIIYEKMGIQHYKVTGRSKSEKWIVNVVDAYIKRKYTGNLMEILAIDPKLNAENFIYIDAGQLEGFLADYPRNGIKAEIEYCQKNIKKLFDNNGYRVNPSVVRYSSTDKITGKIIGEIYK